MLHGCFVTATLFGGELAGAFVELRGHLGGFLRRTAEGDENLGKIGSFHGNQGIDELVDNGLMETGQRLPRSSINP